MNAYFDYFFERNYVGKDLATLVRVSAGYVVSSFKNQSKSCIALNSYVAERWKTAMVSKIIKVLRALPRKNYYHAVLFVYDSVIISIV